MICEIDGLMLGRAVWGAGDDAVWGAVGGASDGAGAFLRDWRLSALGGAVRGDGECALLRD